MKPKEYDIVKTDEGWGWIEEDFTFIYKGRYKVIDVRTLREFYYQLDEIIPYTENPKETKERIKSQKEYNLAKASKPDSKSAPILDMF